MEIPEGYMFTEDHEWVFLEGEGIVRIGITAYAQDALGDIVYFEAPAVGETFSAGDELAVVESVKAVSDVYAPVSGEVTEFNEAVVDTPELINEKPYGDGWLLKMRVDDPTSLDDLMTAEEYADHVGS